MKAITKLALLTSCFVGDASARPLGRHNRDNKPELLARWEAWSYTLPLVTTNAAASPTSIVPSALFATASFPTPFVPSETTSSLPFAATTVTTSTSTSVAFATTTYNTSTTTSTTFTTTTDIQTASSVSFVNTTVPTATPSSSGNTTTPSGLPAPPTNGTGVLQLAIVNNMAGGAVNAYVTGTDDNNNLVILQPNGQWYTPSAGGSQVPTAINVDVSIPLGAQGSTTYVSLPSYISAGRVWLAEGTLKFSVVQNGNGQTALVEPSAIDPSDSNANVNWGFVELTYTKSAGLWANISYVDFVGLVLGMVLQTQDGKTQATPGLQPAAVKEICTALANQTTVDGHVWNELCVNDANGQPLRVLSPGNYMQLHSGAFNDYWTSYVDRVWNQYATQPLTIDTQSAPGRVSCTVQGDKLMCDGDSQGFSRPTVEDIFGCNSGPFAISTNDNDVRRAAVPRLCAAFNRSTLLLAGGNVQPGLAESYYYTNDATNHYSKIVHQYEDDGTGYAFSYDDVTPTDSTPQSGELVSSVPQLLTITVGGAKI